MAQRVTLVAREPIAVLDRATVDPASAKVLFRLETGTTAPVSSCFDLKHYPLVPEITLADGSRGYVVGGEFELRRASIFSAANAPVVWNC
jgi:hypothetical protein